MIQNSQVITRSIGNLLTGKSLAGKLLAGLLFAVKLLVTSSPVRNEIRSIRIRHLWRDFRAFGEIFALLQACVGNFDIGSLRYGDYELRLDERCPLFVALG